jgi:uncharacterized protein
MYGILAKIVSESWAVLGDMAPYLLFGFGVAGVLSVVVSPEWVQRHLGAAGLRSVVKASLWGVPLPLCSCGVIPVAASMRRHGASRAATTAFLLSTPQTGVDSIAVTYALLGPVFAIFRPISALVCGLVGGVLVMLLGESRGNGAAPAEVPKCVEECCTGDRSRHILVRAARYGLVTLPRDLGVALLVGVLLAGAMAALAPPNGLQVYLGGGIASILLMMLVGIPLYVCATASVPIAAGLMYLGASPGAALAFLIAGPASNAAAFTTIWKVLGRRTALLYLLTVALSAVACGLLLNMLVPLVQSWLPRLATGVQAPEEGGWWSSAWAIVLLAVLAMSYIVPRQHGDVLDEAGGSCCHDGSSHETADGGHCHD